MSNNFKANDKLLAEGIQNSGNHDSSIWNIRSNPYWNIFLLALAWALTLTTSTLFTTVGPLSAIELGASDSLAAFTIGVFLIGAAMSSVPSAWLFRNYGRLIGFSCGCVFQLAGSILGSLAIATDSLIFLYFGCLALGLAQGLGQFYRFSAVEVTPDRLKSRAVTYVLSGGIIAAFLGPTSASYSVSLVGEDYQGSYMLIAFIALLNQMTIMLVKFPVAPKIAEAQTAPLIAQTSNENKIRSRYEIITQPLFIISCTVATIAHTVMVMLMSNVTLDMKNNGYSFHATSLVMELHFFAMFAPGFITGKLIEKYGVYIVALVGGIISAGSLVVLAIGTDEWNYMFGMILVGIAWNFSFSAGTVMLTTSYKPIEATEVQAINDFILFTVAGAGSLLSGFVFSEFGWLVLILFVTGLMAAYLFLFSVIWFFSINLSTTELDKDNNQLVVNEEEEDERSDLFKSGRSQALLSTDSAEGFARKSFSDFINENRKKLSFAAVSEINNDNNMGPVRSMSVA